MKPPGPVTKEQILPRFLNDRIPCNLWNQFIHNTFINWNQLKNYLNRRKGELYLWNSGLSLAKNRKGRQRELMLFMTYLKTFIDRNFDEWSDCWILTRHHRVLGRPYRLHGEYPDTVMDHAAKGECTFNRFELFDHLRCMYESMQSESRSKSTLLSMGSFSDKKELADNTHFNHLRGLSDSQMCDWRDEKLRRNWLNTENRYFLQPVPTQPDKTETFLWSRHLSAKWKNDELII